MPQCNVYYSILSEKDMNYETLFHPLYFADTSILWSFEWMQWIKTFHWCVYSCSICGLFFHKAYYIWNCPHINLPYALFKAGEVMRKSLCPILWKEAMPVSYITDLYMQHIGFSYSIMVHWSVFHWRYEMQSISHGFRDMHNSTCGISKSIFILPQKTEKKKDWWRDMESAYVSKE